MFRIIQNNSLLIAIFCVLMVIQITGCGEDSNDDANDESAISEAPALPPAESMMVDLSLFDEKVPAAPGVAPMATYKNFGNAVIRVGGISSGIIAAMSAPAVVFAAAIAHPPVPQGLDTWLWSYSVTIEYVTFTAALTGTKRGTEIDWSMTVSTDAPFRPVMEFLWYTGTSAGTNLAGSWRFFDITTPTEQNPLVTLDWSASELRDEVELAIESVDSRPENERSGDVLNYNVTQNAASLSYEDVSENVVWEILWNLDAGDGSIKVPGYNDGEKACWNPQKQDIVCN